MMLLLCLTSCDGVKISDNGDLDGMWHLVKVDSLHNGVSADYSNKAIFWSFQADLLYVDDKDLKHEACLLRFSHMSGSTETLLLHDPFIYNNFDEADEILSDVTLLEPYGINALEESFKVDKLNRKTMALTSESLSLMFKRY